MAKQVARDQLSCSFQIGDEIVYARDPSLTDAYPPQGIVDPNHVRDNIWKATVVGCKQPDLVGEADPRTGEIQQGVYVVKDLYTNVAQGSREVKVTNVINKAPEDTGNPFDPVEPKGLW